MSTVDDPQFLLRHLRTCFITSDESGLCEMLVEPDLIRADQRKRSNSKLSNNSHSGSEHEISVSPDILSDMDFGGVRMRSSTAYRIEKIKQEKNSRAKIKSIKWRHNDSTEADEETLEQLFGKKPIKLQKPTSNLAKLLTSTKEAESNNPFDEYKKYNGENQVDTKNIDIYMTMQDTSLSKKLLPVTVITTATVQQTIGLTCWKYTREGRKPELHKDLELYSLHMTEDDGEVDDDFPALDHKQPISKFGFAKLALVVQRPAQPVSKPAARYTRLGEVGQRPTEAAPRVRRSNVASTLDRNTQLVTIHIPDHGSTKLLVDVSTVTVGQLLQLVQERRNLFSVANEKFQLGNEFNQKLDEDVLIADSSSREFYMTCSRTPVGPRSVSMIDAGSTTDSNMFPDIDPVTTDETETLHSSMVSHPSQSKLFSVNLVTRVFSNLQVQLSISTSGIEIQPVNTKSAIKSLLMKKTSIVDCSAILACAVTKSRSSGKTVFSLHFNAGDSTAPSIRQHDFEASEAIANEIVSLINELTVKSDENPLLKEQKQRRQSSLY
ncbi:target of rapamycin complex 2 subunit MAPKAP1-like [Watersipora subatra]|uniref:target of rapamycin complex 2 subunit MAPKAP1-like n=1 Tax=Watersipora subatra TaxID=2589382 RepID=UPI00355BCFDA